MNDKATARFTIINERGMHARAAGKLVRLASGFPCQLSLVGPDGQSVSAKSVMGVLLLCGSKGTVIEVAAQGERAQEAIDAIGALIADRFGEDA